MENLGKVAEIQQDGSPLQLGVQGQYDGKSFQIVGRIQLKYGDGFWNEWHLFYSNGESGWLGEAMGEYFICAAKDTGGGLPSQTQLSLGEPLTLDGETFVVTGQTSNQLSAYEGELPFLVERTQPFQAFDLRSASGRAATIDYADQPPTLFLGEYQPFQAFNFTGLRVEGEPPNSEIGARLPAGAAALEKFNCPTCGAPHTVDGGVRTKVLVCEYCGSGVDVSDSSLKVIWQEEQMREELQAGTEIGLGSVAKVFGLEYKMIGYVKKSVTYEGIKYPWTEYLLYNRTSGYLWMVESDGHYTLMVHTDRLPTRSNGNPVSRPGPETITYEGENYRHFQSSTATVDAVAGEFYWRVRRGESATNYDYVCPPHTLSMEASPTGFVWSQGVYKTEDEIKEMFGLDKKLRTPVGVAPPQPNPHVEPAKSVWRTFWTITLVAFALLLTGIASGSAGTPFRTKGEQYETYRPNPQKESEEFKISGHGNVAFDFQARLSQRWMFIKAELVNVQTKKVYKAGATLESFGSKGRNKKVVRLSGVPKGRYKLRWDVVSGTKSKTPDTADTKKKSEKISYSIKLKRGARVWGWFWMMVFILLPIPLMMTSRRSGFETRRWYNSDYG